MKEPPHRQVAALFDELIDLTPADRSARLNGLISLDHETAAQLRRLLEAATGAGDFLGVCPRQAIAESEPVRDDSGSGTAVGPYRLIRRLGTGGTGVVWLAHDTRLERPVALKIFRGDDAAAAALMQREARLAARLNHPHIAIIHEMGITPEGVPFIAMAWAAAGSLTERIANGPLAVEPALDLMIQVARALAAAHAAGIVHRDVKPDNLLLNAEGQVCLADFGAAQWNEAASDAPRAGTLQFLAPEQLRHGPVDHRADLWAVGVTLYQALTGRLPFEGSSVGSVAFAISHGAPRPPGQLVTLPPTLDALIMALLAKEPDQRPSDAVEVGRRLEAARSGIAARARATGVPRPSSSLIGREGLIGQALELLAERRLVTLTGPGGTGKTRLALELAVRTEGQYLAGCCFVELATLRDGRELPHLLAAAFGIPEGGEADITGQILRASRDTERLLVLDNCEHLDSVAAFVTTLLRAAPQLRVLATSRSPLGVAGEQDLPLPPLALPSGDDDTAAPAVALLVDRIRERDPGFAVNGVNAKALADICRRLDGLPLAIELAAGRVRTLGLVAVAERLADSASWLHAAGGERPERHRTIDATIAWSHALLDEAEQRLFRYLAPFVGGFDLEQAAAVGRSIGLGRDPGTVVESLVEKSLLLPVQLNAGLARYTQLLTIRAYATARLREHNEDAAARSIHAALCLDRATAAGAEMYGPLEAKAHARLQPDQTNMRDALVWLMTNHDLDRAAQLAVALHRHWLLAGRFTGDIVARLDRLDQLLSAGPASRLHADLLRVLGSLSGVAGAHQSVTCAYFERAQEMYRGLGEVRGEALVLNHVGWSSLLLGRYGAAMDHSRAAQTVHRKINDSRGVAVSHINLGWVALMRTELDAAEEHFGAARTLQEELGDRRAIAYAIGHTGTVALYRGDPVTALACYEHDDMRAIVELGDRVAGPTFELWRSLAQHAAQLDLPVLARVRDTLLPQLQESNNGWSIAFAHAVLGRLQIDADAPEAAEAALAEAQRIAECAGLVSLAAECQALRGEAALRAGRIEMAARHLGASLATRRRIGEPLGVITVAELTVDWLVRHTRERAARDLLREATRVRSELGTARLPRWAGWIARLETSLDAPAVGSPDDPVHAASTQACWPELGDRALVELSR